MRIKVRRPLALASGIILAAMVASPCAAKSYSVERIEILATIHADGSLQIEEDLTYHFDGKFRFGYRDIRATRGEVVGDFAVTEGETLYKRMKNESPGSYAVKAGAKNTRITWFFNARNESRTFRLSYTIAGALHRYPDIGELYYKLVGSDWDRPIGSVETTVRFAEGVPAGKLWAWAHGPLHGRVDLPGDGTIQLTVSPLPARTFWEVRALFPESALGLMDIEGSALREQAIRNQETTWAEDANRRRQRAARQAAVDAESRERKRALAARLLPVSIVSGVAGFAIWLLLFSRHGRAHQVRTHSVPGEIPSDDPPVMVMALCRTELPGAQVTATLLDLARRGHLVIREEEYEKRGWFGRVSRVKDYAFESTGKAGDDPRSFERELLNYSMNEVGEGTRFRMSELKEAARRSPTKFQRWLKGWQAEIKTTARSRDFFESAPAAIAVNVICAIVVAGAGIAISVVTQSPVGLPAIILGAVQLLLSFTLRRRTVTGQELYAAWQEFERHLLSISKAMGPPSLTSPEWERYLVYAVAFGIHKKVLPALQLAADRSGFVPPNWYIGFGDSQGTDLAGLGDGLAGMVSAVSTSMSSSAGTGGGASSGGGGGAGGGGGGAG